MKHKHTIRLSGQRGYTIVELIVAMGITAFLSVVLIAFMVSLMGQTAVSSVRTAMTSSLQTALIRISDDVRTSSNPALCNLTPDVNAPQTLTGAAASVPCPADATNSNQQTFWRLTSDQIVINRTPQTASGELIYDDPATLAGKRDTIIYYVRGDALYKRIIAATYTTPLANAITTNTCAVIATGGCQTDTKILDGLDTSATGGPFVATYYDGSGNVIVPSGTDYSSFISARSISVTLKMKRTQSGQDISRDSSMRMQFRGSQVALTAPEPEIETPTTPTSSAKMFVGPGGVDMASASIVGGDVYVQGGIDMTLSSSIATSVNPIRVTVSNFSCGAGASYPSRCATQPIPLSWANMSSINGPVCANDQTSTVGLPGLIAGCSAPKVDTPVFNKSVFTGQTTSSVTSSTLPCTTPLQANTRYIGNLDLSTGCRKVINGSNVYIKGGISAYMGGFTVSESMGTTRPIIVTDGKIRFNGFGSSVTPNSYGSTPYFISYASLDAACSNSDTCTTISPTQLKATIDTWDGDSFGNASPIVLITTSAPGTSFYAYFGRVSLALGSNAGSLGGQAVDVTGSTISLTTSPPLPSQ